MRVPASGGPPQLVLEGRGISGLACARSPATLCVFSEETPDRKQLIFSALDPAKGRGKGLTRVLLKQPGILHAWDLSGDGSRIALTQYDYREDRVQILPLGRREPREIKVRGWRGLDQPSWAADGKGLFVAAMAGLGATILIVDLQGRGQVVWRQRFPIIDYPARGVPSPDGRHLAVFAVSADRNVWLLENF